MIAKKPIKVYKLLRPEFDENGKIHYYGPIFYYEYKLGENKPSVCPPECEATTNVGKGYIHANSNVFAAFSLLIKFGGIPIVVRAVIPEGAKYFVGINGDICADRLVIDDLPSVKRLFKK